MFVVDLHHGFQQGGARGTAAQQSPRMVKQQNQSTKPPSTSMKQKQPSLATSVLTRITLITMGTMMARMEQHTSCSTEQQRR